MDHASETETIRRSAAAWVVRLHSPSCTEADRAAFEAWRDASFHNEAAYERELAAWERLDRLSVLGAGDGPVDPELLAPPRPARRRPSPLRLAAGVALALAIGASAVAVNAPPAYATGVGERRVIVLKDGSRIELNTDSKVVVRLRGGEREVRLVRGEALFQVAAESRPFVVVTEHARITTVGSELAVRLKGEAAVVRVSDGSVELQPEGRASVALAARTEAVADVAGAVVHPVSAEEIVRAQAWRQGGVWLDGRSLADAVEEFNRYNERKLVLDDPSLGRLRLGGYFRTGDIQGFVAALTSAFPIRVNVREDAYHLQSRT